MSFSHLAQLLMLEIEPVQLISMVMIVLLVVCIFVLWLSIMKLARLWLQAFFANAKISFMELIGMRLRKTDPRVIVVNRIMAVQAGLELTTRDLESYYLAGVDIPRVVRALTVAKRNGIELSLDEAAKRDLAGRDVLAEVQSAIKTEEPGPAQHDDKLTDVLGHEKSI